MTRRLLLILAVTACKDEATPLDLADVPTTIVAEGPTSVTGSVDQSVPVVVSVTDADGAASSRGRSAFCRLRRVVDRVQRLHGRRWSGVSYMDTP